VAKHIGPIRPNCNKANMWTFSIECVADDLYAWSGGGDASLETVESIKDRLRNMIGDGNGLGGSALDGTSGKE
jgi:hypothetical protein